MNEEYLNQEEFLEEDPQPKTAISKKEFEEYDSSALEIMRNNIDYILRDRADEFYNNDYETFYNEVEAMALKYPNHKPFNETTWIDFFDFLPLPEGVTR